MFSSGIQAQTLVLIDSFPSHDKYEKKQKGDNDQFLIKLVIMKNDSASCIFLVFGFNSQQGTVQFFRKIINVQF